MNLDAIKSGKSVSQIRREMPIQMVSSFLCETELSVLASVETPKICSYAEYTDLGKKKTTQSFF